jgi:Cu-Zn family superoxide dismutase
MIKGVNWVSKLAAVLLALSLAACVTTDEHSAEFVGYASLERSDGSEAGFARLFVRSGELSISVTLQGFEPGEYPLSLDGRGSCASRFDTPNSARLAPTEDARGSGGNVLPQARVGASGVGTVSDLVEGPVDQALPGIFDADGTALLVLAAPLDATPDLSEMSNEPLACAVLRRP